MKQPTYRPDIDGLRAVAVLTVVAFHAFPNSVKAGFIGVDIFFVISGFLISTIVYENLEKGRFSLAEFYARRVKRIFPALALVLAASYVFGWFALLSDEYRELGKHVASGAGFIANFVLWMESGYFDRSAETKPLLHLWSLGVEEQFYILWPVLIWMVWKWRVTGLFVLATALLSFYLNIRGVKRDVAAAFFSPQTRFWELLSGSLLAWVRVHGNYFSSHLKAPIARWLSSGQVANLALVLPTLFSLSGAVLLAYGYYSIDRSLEFPGKNALIPVVATVLIISAGQDAWLNRTVLSNRLLVWFGLISFPLYLWHWPLISFVRITESKPLTDGIFVILIVLSVALAWLTYELIEKPIRFGASRNLNPAVLLALMALLGCVGYATYNEDGFPFRLSKYEKIQKAIGEWEFPGTSKAFKVGAHVFYFQESREKHASLFIGDSNIEHYYSRIDQLIRQDPDGTNSAIFATGEGCLPIPQSPHDNPHRFCEYLMEDAAQYAKQHPEIRNVIIGSLWNNYLGSGQGVVGEFHHGSHEYVKSLARLSVYIKGLTAADKKVYVLLSIPSGTDLDPREMVRRTLRQFPHIWSSRNGGTSRKKLDEKYGAIQADLRRVAESQGAIVIDPKEFLCDEAFCPAVDRSGNPIYRDSGHLRPSYVRQHATFIDATVRKSE